MMFKIRWNRVFKVFNSDTFFFTPADDTVSSEGFIFSVSLFSSWKRNNGCISFAISNVGPVFGSFLKFPFLLVFFVTSRGHFIIVSWWNAGWHAGELISFAASCTLTVTVRGAVISDFPQSIMSLFRYVYSQKLFPCLTSLFKII